MRVIPEIKVECATQQEYDALVEWIEEQGYCTVEFNVLTGPQRRLLGGKIVSITPWGEGDRQAQWEEFAAELQDFVERA